MTPTYVALPKLVWTHPGNRGRRVRALCRLIAWQAWQRATGRPWTIAMPGGRRLHCEPHSTGATGVLYCRLPDWQEMNLVLDYLRPGDVFLDVGANVGVYSLLASAVPEVEVWAFEPSSATFDKAIANVNLNGLEGRVRVVHAAVAEAAGQAFLTVGLGTVNRVVDQGEVAQIERVDVVTVDGFLPEPTRGRVRMMKIDVEGNELRVLRGAEAIVKESRPVVIVEGNDVDGLASWLSQLDYRPFTYSPERRELVETAWTPAWTGNIIAISDRELAGHRVGRVAVSGQRTD